MAQRRTRRALAERRLQLPDSKRSSLLHVTSAVWAGISAAMPSRASHLIKCLLASVLLGTNRRSALMKLPLLLTLVLPIAAADQGATVAPERTTGAGDDHPECEPEGGEGSHQPRLARYVVLQCRWNHQCVRRDFARRSTEMGARYGEKRPRTSVADYFNSTATRCTE